MVDEVRLQVRRELEGIGLSMESASYLVDDRPPGDWGELVTNTTLDLRLEALEQRMHANMANLASELRKEMRDQTRWLTGVLVVAIGVVAALSRVT
jgi:hypothetical protein